MEQSITLVAEDFSRCSKLNGTDCSGTCKMYDLAKYQKPSTLPPAPVDPVDPTKPPVDPTKPTMNGYCQPLSTITDPASKESCYKGKDAATCDTTKCFWKEVCAATTPIPTDMKCTAPYWDTNLCRYKCPATFICMNKDKSAKDTCSKIADKEECYKEGNSASCYWGEDPATQCKPPAGSEPQQCTEKTKAYWDTYRCEYKCPPTGYCKWDLQPKDGPPPAGKVNPCYVSQDEKSCGTINECSWYDYEKNRPKQLFSEAFCHPVKTDKEMTTANWEDCIGKDATTCLPALCAFDTGVELIPKNEDYCAPMYMTDDVKTIVRCTEAKDAVSCMPEYFKVKTDPTYKPTNAPVC
jgi:hypothetical protein